jgi:mono/diheme cytochrome c family protein
MTWFNALSARVRYLLIALAAFVVVGIGLLWWLVLGPGPMDFAGGETVALADYHAGDPTGVPSEPAHASLVKRGEYLAHAADCQACHTAHGGVPYAGGLAFILPFGTIYSANITPDKDSGIGTWSDASFLNAVHRGIDDEGERLYPAMPYASYTRITDADVLAIKAYLFSLKPVHNAVPPDKLAFPFDQRWLMGIWSFFYNPDKRFEPNTARSAQWNRGAYLAEALGHCGECHTPRNLAFALDNRRKYAGEIQTGWRAYNITQDKDAGVGTWSAADLAQFLSTGHAEGHGSGAGPMAEAIDDSLKYLTPGDTAALVAYLQTVPARASRLPAPKTTPAPASHREGVATADAGLDQGKHLFAGACASCHAWTGVSPLTPYATLTGSRAVNDPSATNVAQIVIRGLHLETRDGKVFMPAFGATFSDAEVAAVANYVTARFGAKPSAVTAADVATLRHQSE